MRGDRPAIVAARPACALATPHARGSTAFIVFKSSKDRGYPACAGIDPTSPYMTFTLTRLPRMRGDRPRLGELVRDKNQATPHARGSTSDDGGEGFPQSGYPACAGIDPRQGGRHI